MKLPIGLRRFPGTSSRDEARRSDNPSGPLWRGVCGEGLPTEAGSPTRSRDQRPGGGVKTSNRHLVFAAPGRFHVGAIKKTLLGQFFAANFCGEISMAKPPLTVIGHAGTGREPPIVLGERGRALWDSLRREFVIADAAGIELLAQAGAAADRAEALRAAIDRDGEVVQTRTGPRAHPGLRDELSNRAFIVRTLEMTTAL
jgi:hypothetical protein